MYRKIVVGHDLHTGGDDALVLGRLIAGDAAVVVAGVFPSGQMPHGFESRWREEERAVVDEIERIAHENNAEAEAFPSSSPARGLHELAEEIEADLVVVGSSRHSKLGQLLAGNVGLALLQGSSAAVAIAPHGYAQQAPKGLPTIVVAFDGSHEADLALQAAVDLAEATEATLKLVAVAEPPPLVHGKGGGDDGAYRELTEAIEGQLREELDQAVSSIPQGVLVEATLVAGDPTSKLVEAASAASLVMLGSRAYGPVRRVLLGSVSTSLMRAGTCPVLVHPRGAEVHKPEAQERYAEVGS